MSIIFIYMSIIGTFILYVHFSSLRSSRIERLGDENFEQSFALNNMSRFFTSQDDSPENLEILVSLPPLVIPCLSALKTYLADFKLEKVLKNIKYENYYVKLFRKKKKKLYCITLYFFL